ncbi:histidine phosphatase family protein [Bacillus alkalicellulosilyticus]|uniref:histidine phosphatase family protein n=1 Tax=Alkalihalobacterium alkalicellulosilyticum TaxID=1912214 RepID=UPI0009979978|nr:histidine phosphatase family protein [Bacillus alkalicellulosilyticus]
MTNLYFVRHAHSTYTPDEYSRPLSEKGMLDANRVTEALKKEDIHGVISSPYVRAIQTVEGIANYIKKDIHIVEDLKERTLTTTPAEDFTMAITKVWDDPTFCWEGGESNIVAQKRGVTSVLSLLEQYEGKNIVIGTHGNIMVLIMNYFDASYSFHFWKNLMMPDIYRLTYSEKNLKEVTQIQLD